MKQALNIFRQGVEAGPIQRLIEDSGVRKPTGAGEVRYSGAWLR